MSLILAVVSAAHAHVHTYQADLTGANEAVPNSSPAIGVSTVTLDLDLITILIELDFSDLTGSSTAAFVHGPTSIPLIGFAGPMTPALVETGFPMGVVAGGYSHLFDLTDAPGYDPAFITEGGGTVSDALNVLISAFEGGKAYLSIQSVGFPGGEFRGFYTEVREVPEPTSIAMMGLGFCALAIVRRRKNV